MQKNVHGGDVYRYRDCIDFSANCNPLGTPEGVKRAIVQAVDGLADTMCQSHLGKRSGEGVDDCSFRGRIRQPSCLRQRSGRAYFFALSCDKATKGIGFGTDIC